MEEPVPFASFDYFVFLGLLLFARCMDFVSTWVATPNLVLEGNPIAKKLGWKLGIFSNVGLCFAFAFLPLAAIIIATTSILVAARNFQSAWLMRTLGEEGYRQWYVARLIESHKGLYLFCLFAQTGLYGLVGGSLMFFTQQAVPLAIGLGIIGYAFTVLLYTLLSVWKLRRRSMNSPVS
jgi:hypothetical protein